MLAVNLLNENQSRSTKSFSVIASELFPLNAIHYSVSKKFDTDDAVRMSLF